MTASVACIGIAVLDHIYAIPELPARDVKLRATSFHQSGGGMAAGAAAGVARLGGRAAWIGRLGADTTGGQVLAALDGLAVDLSMARQIEAASTGHAAVLVDTAGNRAVVACVAQNLPEDAGWLDLQALAAHDCVLADLRWQAGALAALQAARAAGKPGVLDADSMATPHSLELVASASHCIFSEQGLLDFYGTHDPLEGLLRAAQHCDFVAVTRGARGVAWLDADGLMKQLAAPRIDARESLGAGDLFHGAFALGLAEGQSEQQALELAVAAASLKCTRQGGWASFPNREEVELWRARTMAGT